MQLCRQPREEVSRQLDTESPSQKDSIRELGQNRKFSEESPS